MILGSVLFLIRFIFSLCLYKTKTVNIETMTSKSMFFMNKVAIMETNPVIIEDSETYLEMYNVIKNDAIMMINNNGLTPKIMPPEVATAFPPLKFANNGYV